MYLDSVIARWDKTRQHFIVENETFIELNVNTF